MDTNNKQSQFVSFWRLWNTFFRVLVENCEKSKKVGNMNHLQKWIVDNEYREIFSVLPEYMKLRTIEQYSLFLITVVVQRGFYKNKRIQFLIDVPNDYNKSVSYRRYLFYSMPYFVFNVVAPHYRLLAQNMARLRRYKNWSSHGSDMVWIWRP